MEKAIRRKCSDEFKGEAVNPGGQRLRVEREILKKAAAFFHAERQTHFQTTGHGCIYHGVLGDENRHKASSFMQTEARSIASCFPEVNKN